MERQLYLNTKFGNKENAQLVYKRIENEGKKNKIYFQFNQIIRTPNSFFSHKLLAFAHTKKNQNKVLELLFYKYFIEGEDIGNVPTLINISKDANIYDKNIENYILSNQDNNSLINEEKQAKKIGISSVPAFIFNKEFILSGAQPIENFNKIINSLTNYV